MTLAALAALLILSNARPGLCADDTLISISAALPALPVISGVTQEIVIKVTAPGLAEDRAVDVRLSAESGWGMLLIGGVPASSGVARCMPGVPERVPYRWAGAVPIAMPVVERIRAEIPLLGASGEVDFQVGLDLRITEITMPDAAAAGKFNPIAIRMGDAFNPDIDAVTLLERVGVKPEVSISLVADSAARSGAVEMSPVAGKFFEGEGGTISDAAYPGQKLVPGVLARDPGGSAEWRSSEGGVVGFTPPSEGKYRIEAALKSNAGGLPIKMWESPPFEVSGERLDVSGLPELISSTIEVMSGVDWNTSVRALDEIRPLLDGGEDSLAAESLGVYLHAAFSASPVRLFGKYANALSATGRGADSLAAFLRSLARGYGSCGVLLVTKSGVASWSVSAAGRASTGPAAYENERYIAIPFEAGGDFTLRLKGSGLGGASLWKIIPLGVNAKKYPEGKWVKDVFVNTQELVPSPRNVKF
jgi:hypothetical protein